MVRINQTIIAGRVGQTPTERKVGETSYINFSIASNESYLKNGEWNEKTSWWNISSSNQYAHDAIMSLVPGDMVIVTGKLTQSESIKDGVKKSYWGIFVNSRGTVQVISRITDSRRRKNQEEQQGSAPTQEIKEEDELPF